MTQEMKVLNKDDAMRSRSLGLPVLLDSRTENGKPVLRRAGERQIPRGANALAYLAAVRGTSAGVVQFYEAAPAARGQTVVVEPQLTAYDQAQLPALKAARVYQ